MFRIRETKARPCLLPDRPGGFSLIELLIVIAILGIITGAALTQLQSTINDHLDAAAQVVASDLAYVRNLSVANNSSYRITFSPGESRYYFEHSGTNSSLDSLPVSPHGVKADSATRQTTDIAFAAFNGAAIRVAAVYQLTPEPVKVTDLEFGPLGETTRTEETVIWLSAGQGDARHYVPLTVNPVTGMPRIGDQANTLPSGNQPDPT